MQNQINNNNNKNCMICGAELVYSNTADLMECYICNQRFSSNASCANGHYVCDACHSAGVFELLTQLKHSSEKDPGILMQQLMNHPSVHMHGPEHHSMVPCVLLTAYKNCGGSIDLDACLSEAISRGKNVPGGICGFWGSCGAAIGAGIFTSIVTGSTPLAKQAWALSNHVTAMCLNRIAEVGGPRCCKRSSFIAIETVASASEELFGIPMQTAKIQCTHSKENKECIGLSCPFYAKQAKKQQDKAKD